MKQSPTTLARCYEAALEKHLKSGAQVPAADAREMGHLAIASGLGTLDLVQIHEQALTRLVPAGGSSQTRIRAIKRATKFFAEALIPIENTHHAAVKDKTTVKQLAQTLDQSTADLATVHLKLEQGIIQRKTAESALRKSRQDNTKLLAESRRLQTHLRKLTRQIIATQENDRWQASIQLHDEIAQTLLGINVWLLALKATATANAKDLQKEIASMEQLVESSTQTMKRFVHKFGIPHEA
jgi:signal transduction histidine kinase